MHCPENPVTLLVVPKGPSKIRRFAYGDDLAALVAVSLIVLIPYSLQGSTLYFLFGFTYKAFSVFRNIALRRRKLKASFPLL